MQYTLSCCGMFNKDDVAHYSVFNKPALMAVMILLFNSLFISSSVARGTPESFADIVQDVIPAVVNVSTTQLVDQPRRSMRNIPQLPRGGPWDDMFKDFLDQFEGQGPDEEGESKNDKPKRRASSLGSGFIIDGSGLVVTNNHVIEDADEIKVILYDDTILEAKVIGRDPKVDIALLKVEVSEPLPTVKWGNSKKMRVGDWSVAIGNPFGIGVTVTAGIISARSRRLSNGSAYDDYIQTDAAINRGNSGGPLINMNGEVIGINTAIFSPTGASVGIGFAAPSNLARSVISDLKEFGRTRRGWLGVQIQSVTAEIAESLGLDKARGALVSEVIADSPADKAGVKQSDVILSFDGKSVNKMPELPLIVAESDIDRNVKMVVWRDGREKTLRVLIGELEEEDLEVALDNKLEAEKGRGSSTDIPQLGLTVAELSDSLRDQFELLELPRDMSGLVIVGVEQNSDAAGKNLRPGDIIVEIQQQEVNTAKEAKQVIVKALENDRSVVLLRTRRGDQFRLLAIKLNIDG